MKKLIVFIIITIVILITAAALWRISNSRTFQFLGEIVPRVNTTHKLVALTFDDGPTPEGTDQILAVLGEENVKATFFVTGGELAQNPEQGKKIVAAGHELGNHSYSHDVVLISELEH